MTTTRITRSLRVALPVWPIAIPAVAVWGLLIGFPQWTTDWFFRPQFVQGCALGHWDDDAWLKACNEAYARYRAVQARGWRPKLPSDATHPREAGDGP